MKAMQLAQPAPIEKNPLQLKDLPRPALEPGEILVRIRACGVCHTDLHIVEGELFVPRLPIVPGHQVIGIVEKTAGQEGIFKPGDRVGIPWLNSTCGNCKWCRSGRENLCESACFTGFHTDGGFAEYITIAESFAYSIPEIFSDEGAAPLMCAGIIGYRALRLSGFEEGGTLGLYGFGASAHIAIQIARYRDAKVFVFSSSKAHQALAIKLGAIWAGSAEENPGTKLDHAIIFAPAGELVIRALQLLNKGGTLALAGIYMSSIPEINYNDLLYYERKITSVTASTRQDASELLDYAAKIPIQTETEVFALPEVNRALRLLKERKINGAGVLKIDG